MIFQSAHLPSRAFGFQITGPAFGFGDGGPTLDRLKPSSLQPQRIPPNPQPGQGRQHQHQADA